MSNYTKGSPDPRRQLQGVKSRASGKAFEARLNASFDYYRNKGYAQIDKTPEPMKVLRSLEHGHFETCFDKKAQPDYKGTINGGRSVMFEAKYTSKDRIYADVVNKQQWEYLSQAAKLGAFCYLLVGFPSGNVYKIPWEIWSEMEKYFGRKYVKESELNNYICKLHYTGLPMIFD